MYCFIYQLTFIIVHYYVSLDQFNFLLFTTSFRFLNFNSLPSSL